MEERSVELDRNLDYNALKDEFRTICNLKENDNKVIKIRNADLALIPLISVLEDNTKNIPVIVDVTKVNYNGKHIKTLKCFFKFDENIIHKCNNSTAPKSTLFYDQYIF